MFFPLHISAWLFSIPFLWATPCSASQDSFQSSLEYNAGQYGRIVTQTFRTSSIIVARPNLMMPFDDCSDGMKLFVSLRGSEVKRTSPLIYDTNGDFLWGLEEQFGQIYNFQVQDYKGEPHLVFWAGDDLIKGHGQGFYYMFNQHYELVKIISAANNFRADLHVFEVTPEDNVIFSIFSMKKVDISSIHPRRTMEWIWDCLFQELNPDTGELVFEWRASDHVNLYETYYQIIDIPTTPWVSELEPWDPFHINSVEKDQHGNYLVSLRHTRSILYVDGRTGDILWRLGGKLNSFTDYSDHKATEYIGQHDVHWVDETQTAITMFHNRIDWREKAEGASVGLRLNIDTKKLTVAVDRVIEHPFAIISSISQGSYQTLPNGNILLGYGFNAAMTEFTANGTLLCDAWWLPQNDFGSMSVGSYRMLKFNWVGKPKTAPSVSVQDGSLYVSWLGATEVRSWAVSRSANASGGFETMVTLPKAGFETQIILRSDLSGLRYVRVAALDFQGQQLGVSRVADTRQKSPSPLSDGHSRTFSLQARAMGIFESVCVTALTTISALLLFVLGLMGWRRIGRARNKASSGWNPGLSLEDDLGFGGRTPTPWSGMLAMKESMPFSRRD